MHESRFSCFFSSLQSCKDEKCLKSIYRTMRCLIDQMFSQLSPSNASWDRHVTAWNHDNKISGPLRLTIAFFLVLANLLMMIGIWKTNDKKLSISKKMYFSSAVCGILTGLTMPFHTLSLLKLENVCLYEYISETILTFTVCLDFGKLISIGIVRFISLKWPLKRLVTKKILFVIWFMEIALAVISSFSSFVGLAAAADTSVIKLKQQYILIYGLTSGGCILLTFMLTFLLWLTLQKKPTIVNNTGDRYKKKASSRILIIALAWIACNIPLCILCFVIMFESPEKDYMKNPLLISRRLIMWNWFISLVILYSGLNSCIYMWMDKKIVVFYKSCYKRRVWSKTYEIKRK